MYDLAALGVAAACFAFAFLSRLRPGPGLMAAADAFGLAIALLVFAYLVHALFRGAYLRVVPLQYPEDSAQKEKVALALPLLEAVELAALRAGVPVDARIEKGRSLTHALRRLWEVESFDRIVAPAPGFTAKELAWILTHAPTETIVLRPSPAAAAA